MNQLRMTIFGDATELLIGTFLKEGADWIMGYCEEFKPYTSIEEVWYGDEIFIPEEWAKGKDGNTFGDILHVCGFTFGDRNEIQWFLDGNLAPNPKITGIYINNSKEEYNLSEAPRNYRELNLPCLDKSLVAVYHGAAGTLSMDYALNIQKPFFCEKLKFHFINCDEYGYILTDIDYEGQKMKRFYSGSNILVGSGWHSPSPENMVNNFPDIKTRKLLNVKFKQLNRQIHFGES